MSTTGARTGHASTPHRGAYLAGTARRLLQDEDTGFLDEGGGQLLLALGILLGLILIAGVVYLVWYLKRHKREAEAAEEARKRLEAGGHSAGAHNGMTPAGMVWAVNPETGEVQPMVQYLPQFVQPWQGGKQTAPVDSSASAGSSKKGGGAAKPGAGAGAKPKPKYLGSGSLRNVTPSTGTTIRVTDATPVTALRTDSSHVAGAKAPLPAPKARGKLMLPPVGAGHAGGGLGPGQLQPLRPTRLHSGGLSVSTNPHRRVPGAMVRTPTSSGSSGGGWTPKRMPEPTPKSMKELRDLASKNPDAPPPGQDASQLVYQSALGLELAADSPAHGKSSPASRTGVSPVHGRGARPSPSHPGRGLLSPASVKSMGLESVAESVADEDDPLHQLIAMAAQEGASSRGGVLADGLDDGSGSDEDDDDGGNLFAMAGFGESTMKLMDDVAD